MCGKGKNKWNKRVNLEALPLAWRQVDIESFNTISTINGFIIMRLIQFPLMFIFNWLP